VYVRTYIFSLGVVMFEMLTGRLPFSAATPAALTRLIGEQAAPAPSAVNKSVPAELDTIVGQAMAKAVDQRPASAATLAAELRGLSATLAARSETQEAAPALGSTRRGRGA